MTLLHLVLIDPPGGSAEPPAALRRALDAVPGGPGATVHAGVAAFLRAAPGLADRAPPAGADDPGRAAGAVVLFCVAAAADAGTGADAVIDVLRRVAATDGAADGPPWPVAVLGAPLEAEAHAALVEAGVHAWADVAAVDARGLRALAGRAAARWCRERALRAEMAQLRTRLDERKWVDKAKGLLMLARGMGEDEAFALLRSTAMHANLRLGEVARAVVDAAQWAEAVNRAGQLRMLSQRLARLAAQQIANVEPADGAERRRAVAERIDATLAHLARLPSRPDGVAALARVGAAWAAFGSVWPQRAAPRDIARIDAAADVLLEAAEALAETLQAASGRRALRIVNLCGRQRMLAERIAKTALLATLGVRVDAARLPATAAEFEAALAELERAPLSSPAVRAALAAARDEWLRLALSLQSLGRPQGAAALARSTEALVDTFDQLAAHYEHSLQVILA